MEYSCERHVLKIFQPSGKFMYHARRTFQILGCCEVFDIGDQNSTYFLITKCNHVLLKVACLHSNELKGEKLKAFYCDYGRHF